MKLSRAFTERARLTRAYEKIVSNINSLEFNIEVKDPSYQGTVMTSYTYAKKEPKFKLDDLMVDLTQVGNALALFNAAIDEANAKSEARFILSQLTNLRRQLTILSRFVQYQDNFVEKVEEYDRLRYDDKGNQGCYVTKYYIPASKNDFTALYKETEKSIRELEDKLAEINATVEVEVPAAVTEVLEYL